MLGAVGSVLILAPDSVFLQNHNIIQGSVIFYKFSKISDLSNEQGGESINEMFVRDGSNNKSRECREDDRNCKSYQLVIIVFLFLVLAKTKVTVTISVVFRSCVLSVFLLTFLTHVV